MVCAVFESFALLKSWLLMKTLLCIYTSVNILSLGVCGGKKQFVYNAFGIKFPGIIPAN